MSTSRFTLLVGLALGAVWGLTESFGWTVLALFLAAVGYLVGLVLEGRVDLEGLTAGDRRTR